MISISSTYLEPDEYFVVQNVPTPNPVGGTFIPIFVGLGRKDYNISASIIRGSSGYTDLITDQYSVIDILQIVNTSTNKVYAKNIDYSLTVTGSSYYVNWLMPVTLLTQAAPEAGHTFTVA